MTDRPKILLVDDEESITSSLAFFLTSSNFEVDTAADGLEALEKIDAFQPDLVVLDILMPRMDGREVLRRLRRSNNWTPIILLTKVGESTERAIALEEGADDYINKPFDSIELLARIRAVLRRVGLDRSPAAKPSILISKDLRFDCRSEVVYLGVEKLDLSIKAISLLAYLMRHPNQVHSREQLLDAIWGWDYPAGTRAVDNRIYELRRALGDDPSEPRFIRTVPEKGYLFVGKVEAEK
jgi:DNA-binding response OmpR family regulator